MVGGEGLIHKHPYKAVNIKLNIHVNVWATRDVPNVLSNGSCKVILGQQLLIHNFHLDVTILNNERRTHLTYSILLLKFYTWCMRENDNQLSIFFLFDFTADCSPFSATLHLRII